MTKPSVKPLVIAAALCALAGPIRAQTAEDGRQAYLASCAVCHGADGKGNGVLTAVLKVPPADLTTLARRNDGVFPIAAVSEVIDGRTFIAAHGTRDMPIWGLDTMTRNRIVVIIDYLNTIQAK